MNTEPAHCFGPPPPDPRTVILGLPLLWTARDELVATLLLVFVRAERAVDPLLRATRPLRG